MRQSQSSVLPETDDKGKRPAGSPWTTALIGLAGAAVVVVAVVMMAFAAPQRVPATGPQVPSHSSALVQGRAS